MAIEGLRDTQYDGPTSTSPQVNIFVKELDLLHQTIDHDKVIRTLEKDLEWIESLGVDGEPYIAFQPATLAFSGLAAALDSHQFPRHYPPTERNHVVWSYGEHGHEAGYKDYELGRLALGEHDPTWLPHLRLAVYNHKDTTDKLLHFVDMPYNRNHAEHGETTQLDAFERFKREKEAEYPDIEVTPLGAGSLVSMDIAHRLWNPDTMPHSIAHGIPIKRGFMRDPNVHRRLINPVRSDSGKIQTSEPVWLGPMVDFRGNGALLLEFTLGHKKPDVGLGVSYGPKSLKAKAA
jgi:hypothetical protein